MPDIRPLERLHLGDLERLIVGYTSHECYNVSRIETDASTVFTLELVRLEVPYVKPAPVMGDALVQQYQSILGEGLSFGVYEGVLLVAIELAESQSWNRSVYVHEFRVAEGYRGRGVGLALMDVLAARSREAGLRMIVCETQNTNIPAIRFYRKVGFTLDGIDLTLYTDDDGSEGEVAVFMKRKP